MHYYWELNALVTTELWPVAQSEGATYLQHLPATPNTYLQQGPVGCKTSRRQEHGCAWNHTFLAGRIHPLTSRLGDLDAHHLPAGHLDRPQLQAMQGGMIQRGSGLFQEEADAARPAMSSPGVFGDPWNNTPLGCKP